MPISVPILLLYTTHFFNFSFILVFIYLLYKTVCLYKNPPINQTIFDMRTRLNQELGTVVGQGFGPFLFLFLFSKSQFGDPEWMKVCVSSLKFRKCMKISAIQRCSRRVAAAALRTGRFRSVQIRLDLRFESVGFGGSMCAFSAHI